MPNIFVMKTAKLTHKTPEIRVVLQKKKEIEAFENTPDSKAFELE
jgi:hypothetical protein